MKLSEVIERVISLRDAVRPEAGAPSGEAFPLDLSQSPTPKIKAEEELDAFLLKTPITYIYSIETLMYLGRGDFPIHSRQDFDSQCEALKRPDETVRHVIGNICGKGPLSSYLRKGLQALADSSIDIDSLLDT